MPVSSQLSGQGECPVCAGRRFVRAAPISPLSRTHLVRRVAMWHHAVLVPCFACIPAALEIVS